MSFTKRSLARSVGILAVLAVVVGCAPPDGRTPPAAPPASEIGPGAMNFRFAHLLDRPGPDLIVSDARHDLIYTIEPSTLAQGPLLSDEVRQPGRVEMVDLDVDGRDDLVVA